MAAAPSRQPWSGRRLSRRSFLSRTGSLGLLAAGGTGLLSSCVLESGGTTDTVLRVREPFDLTNLDPAIRPNRTDSTIADCIFEGLVSYKGATDEVVNVLAEEFEASKDGLRYHFKLKRGIPFHQGYGEVTAEDVKFSYERIAGIGGTDLESPYAADWAPLDRVRIDGKYEGEIILKEPFSPLMRSTLPAASGLIVSRKAVEELGKKFNTAPIGSGPFEFTQWTPAQRTTLTAFADYGGAWQPTMPKSPWSQIVILPIIEDSTALNAFEAGDTYFSIIPSQAVDQYREDETAKFVPQVTPNYGFVTMNVKDKLLSNIHLRRAIRSAIDVDGILEAATNGTYERARAIIPKSMGLGYWADAPRYERNLDEARAHLRRSGLRDVRLRVSTDQAEAETITAQIVQANLEEIGIKVDLDIVDSATFNEIPGAGGGGPNRQLVISSFSTEPDPSWSFIWFTCSQVGEWNYTGWCDREFERLYNRATKELDPKKRTELYVRMQQRWDANANIVWLYYETLPFVANNDIEPVVGINGKPRYWAFGKS